MPIPPVSGTTPKGNQKYNEPRTTNYAPNRRHNGVDYCAPKGTQVKASASGVVAFVGKFEASERIGVVKHDKKEKRFTGAYGNVIIIYHGQNIKTQKHICTLYSHLVDNRAMSKGSRIKEDQLIGFVGNTGTRAGFLKLDSGYKLHFEVIESKKEISHWPMRLETDYVLQNQIYRKNPEEFLKSSFKTVFADELVKELVAKLKGKELDRVDLDERAVSAANSSSGSTTSSGGYFDLNFNAGLGAGITFGFLFSEDGVRPYIGLGLMSPSWSGTASPGELTTGLNAEVQASFMGAAQVIGVSEKTRKPYVATGVGGPVGISATVFYVPKHAIDPRKINVIYENYMQ